MSRHEVCLYGSFVLLAVLLSLLIPTPAHAGWKIDRATAIAAKVWHDPCPGQVALRWGKTGDAIAIANGCEITFDAGTPTSWIVFCTVMIHEYGHLAGFQDPTNVADPDHSSNPRSVMAQGDWIVEGYGRDARGRTTAVRYVGADRRCAGRGRPYLGLGPSRLNEVFAYTNQPGGSK